MWLVPFWLLSSSCSVLSFSRVGIKTKRRKRKKKIVKILNIMSTLIVVAGVTVIAAVGFVYVMYFDKEPQSEKK